MHLSCYPCISVQELQLYAQRQRGGSEEHSVEGEQDRTYRNYGKLFLLDEHWQTEAQEDKTSALKC